MDDVGRAGHGFLGAVQFLTRVPVRLPRAVDHARVVPWFPLVGALIGVVVGGAAAGLHHLVPPAVAAACAVAVGLLVTGAFHEDGLADIADAFGGGWTRQRRFEILDDSRLGTYGVAALATSIVVRVVSAASIGAPSALFAAFVASHVVGRTAAVAAMVVYPPASTAGLGAEHARRTRSARTAGGAAVGVALTALATGWWTGPVLGAAVLGVGATGWLAMRKIGGIAGDVLGAIEQVTECLVLVIVSGLAMRHGVWWAR